MILELFVVLIIISLTLVIIGLARPSESAQALIGFFFLFILGLIVSGGNLQYKVGSNISNTYSYDGSGNLNGTTQVVNDNYESFTGTHSHYIGYYLALVSAVGFAGVLYSLRRSKKID